MSESDPQLPPEEFPAPNFTVEESPHPRDPRGEVFWGWHDFFLFVFISIVSLGFAMLSANGIQRVFHLSEDRMNVVFVVSQFVAYGMSFAVLKLMFRAEYGEPLLRSLRWLPSNIPAATLMLAGLGQAFIIVLIEISMAIPQSENAMTKLMADRFTAIVLAVLGVTVAPIAEELAFRGLLQPLLVKFAGVVPGIAVTSLLFGGMHFEQYGSWQSVLLVGLAGAGFGAVRQWTGSTQASAIMHAGYNSVLFLIFFTQKGPPH